MIRPIQAPCARSGNLQVRIIETRHDALSSESYLFQLINLYQQLTDRRANRCLAQLVGSHLHFVLLTEETNLIGAATLVIVQTGIRCRGIVEDVVIDQEYRNAGLGKLLMDQVIKLARNKGCQCLDLTSKPERPGTACFYPKLGFEVVAFARPGHAQGTNLYRYEF